MPSADNKRVAKNAVALTLRMVLVTIVGLYTSRIVLETLGVDDYGIYGVIGGVVGIASFLNTSMAGATSRFITFELGQGNPDKLNKIFSTALIIHVVIALIVAVLAETIGLWFVNYKMNFPPERMSAVNILYQFTIVSMIVGFTQVPYTSAIIAHERMNVYAYFEIINVVLKLAIVYILLISNTDKLILYGALTLAVTVLTALIYRIYSLKHFSETKFKYINDKTIRHQMLTFSGYDLYGNMCVVAKSQGTPILLNLFFGVVANAGASIATTITGVLKGLSMAVIQAFRPQIIKTYASKQIMLMQNMMSRALQFSLFVYGLIAIPLFIKTESILFLWLGQIPPYSPELIRLVLIALFFDIIILINNTGIHSTGNIRNISFISGTLFLLCPIISWGLLKLYILNVSVVYIVDILFYTIIAMLGCFFLKMQIPQLIIGTYVAKVLRITAVLGISLISVYFITQKTPVYSTDAFSSTILNLFICVCISLVILTVLFFAFALRKYERQALIQIIKKKITKFLKRRYDSHA